MFSIRDATFADFKDIVSLARDYGLGTKSYAEWQHLWKDNPVFKDVEKDWPIGWVLENENKRIVGYLGNIPFLYEFKGRRIIATATTSFVVDKNYRNYSLLLMNKFYSQRDVDLFLNTTATYESAKVCSAFKALKVPVAQTDTVLFWITGYQGFISSVFIKKRFPLSCIARYPLSLSIWCIDKLIKRNRFMNQGGGEVQDCKSIDERFDVFWDTLKKHNYNKILRVRNSEYLNWHFKYAIAQKKVWILISGKEHISSYAIFLRQDTPEIGLRRVRLIDFQSIDEDNYALAKMLSIGIKRCQEESVHVLEVIGFNAQKKSIMEGCHPHRRKLPSWPFFYKARNESLAKELNTPEAWDFCFLDGDASI